jgi:RNA polymerase sigma-70 factor (ECF subfamily)
MASWQFERAEDDELVAAIAQGSAPAFAALFHRRRGDVFRFALHMTGSSAAADDITQEVFLALMRDASRYQRGRATVAAWLCGIARNHARRRAVSDHLLTPLSVLGDAGAQAATAAGAGQLAELERVERIEGVRRAVLRLPFKYREVIVLCDLQEMSYADAAAGLGCAVGTVRSRLHRGRALLAEKLAADDRRSASWKAEARSASHEGSEHGSTDSGAATARARS